MFDTQTGSLYEGFYVADELQGEGRLIEQNGHYFIGVFERGRRLDGREYDETGKIVTYYKDGYPQLIEKRKDPYAKFKYDTTEKPDLIPCRAVELGPTVRDS